MLCWGRGLTAVSMDSPSSAIVWSSKTACAVSIWKAVKYNICLHGSPYLRGWPISLSRTKPTACYSRLEQGMNERSMSIMNLRRIHEESD